MQFHALKVLRLEYGLKRGDVQLLSALYLACEHALHYTSANTDDLSKHIPSIDRGFMHVCLVRLEEGKFIERVGVTDNLRGMRRRYTLTGSGKMVLREYTELLQRSVEALTD